MRLSTIATAADVIAEELDDLGDEPDRVADVLWITGARGRRRDSAANPLALYLCRRVRLEGPIRVLPEAGRVEVHTDDEVIAVPLPAPVREFLVRFDRGLYPDVELG